MIRRALALTAVLLAGSPDDANAQVVSHRGFVEARGTWFPQAAAQDRRRLIGDIVAREDVFVDPRPWIRLAAGAEARANSYDQIEESWRVRFTDGTIRRPALAIRRLSASLSGKGLTVDVGKQFIRWGKADVVTPTDRLAPRDYLAVIDNDFLAIRGARLAYAAGDDTFEAVLVPFFTPSRMPLLQQRWSVVPAGVTFIDATPAESAPDGLQTGVRWSHAGSVAEYSLAFYDGFNHLPNIAIDGPEVSDGAAADAGAPGTPPAPPGAIVGIRRSYPQMRMFGGDLVVPTRWVTLTGEVAYFTTTTPATDEYVIYVAQLERQTGEWLLIVGYAGTAITRSGGTATFAPDRGITRSIVSRASYTIDSTRSAAFEAAIRENGDGVYVKGELSKLWGSHWRGTIAGVMIRGDRDDFLGQFRDNSHVWLGFRYSF